MGPAVAFVLAAELELVARADILALGAALIGRAQPGGGRHVIGFVPAQRIGLQDGDDLRQLV